MSVLPNNTELFNIFKSKNGLDNLAFCNALGFGLVVFNNSVF